MDKALQPNRWMKWALFAAGIFNVVAGLVTIGAPKWSFATIGFIGEPRFPQLWQAIGALTCTFGVGFLIASRDPFRHWSAVATGTLAKGVGVTAAVTSFFDPQVPARVGQTVLALDFFWLVPLVVILWGAIRRAYASGTVHVSEEFDDPIRELFANTGQNLEQLSAESPKLVVFLRQAGCTFCRESLARLARQRREIEARGYGIVLVHLGHEEQASAFFERYKLEDVPRISDPECRLYRQVGLDLGSFRALFGLQVWIRGFIAGVLNRHGIGRSKGNAFQMPGAFVVHRGDFVHGVMPTTASKPFDYLSLVCEAA